MRRNGPWRHADRMASRRMTGTGPVLQKPEIVSREFGDKASDEHDPVAIAKIQNRSESVRAQRLQGIEARIEAHQLDHVLGGIEIADQIVAGARSGSPKHENVATAMAGEEVIATPAVDRVRGIAADHHIVAPAALQHVAGGGGFGRSREAANEVIPGAAKDRVD